jgi:hypothetical protein
MAADDSPDILLSEQNEPNIQSSGNIPEDEGIYFTSQASDTQNPTVHQVNEKNQTVTQPIQTSSYSYLAEFVSQNTYPRLASGWSYKFSITVKNAGTTPWSPAVVHLGTDRDRDRIPGFIREDIVGGNPSGWLSANRIRMFTDEITGLPEGDINLNGLIDANETATFEFWLSVPATKADGVYKEYFSLVADGITWFNDLGIYWDVTVDNRPHARFIDQKPYPATLLAGDSYEFWVRFENTGLLPWQDSGPTPVRLGTDRSMDRIPGFVREGPAGTISGWVEENRVSLDRDTLTGELVGDVNLNGQIDPGEIARFRFWYTVPETMESGTYQEYFRPVMDGRGQGWMEDYGLFWANVVDNIAPRPSNISISAQVNRLTVNWLPVSEALSYKVRFKPVGAEVFAVVDLPPTMTTYSFDVVGGRNFEIGVASADNEGISPFTSTILHVESPEERLARLEEEARREKPLPPVRAEEPRLPEVEEEPAVVTGPPAEPELPRDWRQFWLTLLIILGAAGLVTAGYYGYEWWSQARRLPKVRLYLPKPPKREGPPKPPTPPTTRW